MARQAGLLVPLRLAPHPRRRRHVWRGRPKLRGARAAAGREAAPAAPAGGASSAAQSSSAAHWGLAAGACVAARGAASPVPSLCPMTCGPASWRAAGPGQTLQPLTMGLHWSRRTHGPRPTRCRPVPAQPPLLRQRHGQLACVTVVQAGRPRSQQPRRRWARQAVATARCCRRPALRPGSRRPGTVRQAPSPRAASCCCSRGGICAPQPPGTPPETRRLRGRADRVSTVEHRAAGGGPLCAWRAPRLGFVFGLARSRAGRGKTRQRAPGTRCSARLPRSGCANPQACGPRAGEGAARKGVPA